MGFAPANLWHRCKVPRRCYRFRLFRLMSNPDLYLGLELQKRSLDGFVQLIKEFKKVQRSQPLKYAIDALSIDIASFPEDLND